MADSRIRFGWARRVLSVSVAVLGVACGSSSKDGGKHPAAGAAGEGTAGVAGAPNGGSAGSAGSGGSAGGGGTAAEGGVAGDAGEGGTGGELGRLVPVPSEPADKVDLLFLIDNSISMADKQQIFGRALPLVVERLITPVCVDAAGTPTGARATPGGVCSAGAPEFPPIRDLHIAVVSSSLGGHGGQVCAEADDDDKAHLIGSVRPGLRSWNDSGFLAWDPGAERNTPPGATNPATFVADFAAMVAAVGDTGCGYEAPLEAWYRFLVDPDPPSSVTARLDAAGNPSVTEAVYPDPVTLSQRAAFLRPDSLLGIVMLTDENDCSIVDAGQSWLVGTQQLGGTPIRLPRATSVCADDPNDPCCASCSALAIAGCPDKALDPECTTNGGVHTAIEDNLNLRCFDQKRRFGFDFLYPIGRYVAGLTEPLVPNRAGEMVRNPLFSAELTPRARDATRVFFLGIVGVPWQDLADAASLAHPTRLTYLTPEQLVAQDRWSLVLGENGEPPRDGLMLETTLDRSTLPLGPHPLTNEPIAPSSSTNPRQNSINGHETNIPDGMDLQFACTFPLGEPRPCLDPVDDCDCHDHQLMYSSALCQPPGGGPATTTQYYAKAYPSVRPLEVLRGFGELTGNAVVGSICPKVIDSPAPPLDPYFGYNPAMIALVERMKSGFDPPCLLRRLDVDSGGGVECRLLEVAEPAASCAPCSGGGRTDPSDATRAALASVLSDALYCGGQSQPACADLCVCEIEQAEGAARTACQSGANDAGGYCYVDADQGVGNAALVATCPVGRQRRVRVSSDDFPRSGTRPFLLCAE